MFCFYRRFDQKGFKAVEHLWSAIGMCIDSLDSLELKVYYEDFALFQNDVNIKPEVTFINTFLQYV